MGACAVKGSNCSGVHNFVEDEPLVDLPATLAEYFSGCYDLGIPYRGANYHRRFDDVSSRHVLEHLASGIRIWEDAVDLRAAAPESRVALLYHYTNSVGFAAVELKECRPLDILEHLAREAHHFGKGLLTNTKSPEEFGTKDEVLINNHWPRPDDEFQFPSGPPKTLSDWGNPRAGPDHPANKWVSSEVLAATRSKADYCVPLLVPECFVYSIWERTTPDLPKHVEIGCNRFGEKQWTGRDICIVQFTRLGRTTMAHADLEPVERLLRKRVAVMEVQKGPTSSDTISCVSDLAAVLHAMGNQQEAEPLIRRVLENRHVLLRATRDTKSFHQLLVQTVESLETTQEAEQRLRDIVKCCHQTLGPRHPYSLTALCQLAENLHCSRQGLEATMMLQDVLFDDEALAGGQGTMLCDGPAVVKAHTYLASLYHARGRHEDALFLMERVLERAEKSMGPAHTITMQARKDLAFLQKAIGNSTQSEELLRQAVKCCEVKLGTTSTETLDALTELALFLQQVRKTDEAEELLRRVSEIRDTELGPMHTDAVSSLDTLAVFMKAEGRFQEALPLLQQVLRRLEASTTASSASRCHSSSSPTSNGENQRVMSAQRLFSALQPLAEEKEAWETDSVPSRGEEKRGAVVGAEGRYCLIAEYAAFLRLADVMGFEECEASATLAKVGGDVERALEKLMAQR